MAPQHRFMFIHHRFDASPSIAWSDPSKTHPRWNYVPSRWILGYNVAKNAATLWEYKWFFCFCIVISEGGRDETGIMQDPPARVKRKAGMEGGISHFVTADRRKEMEKEENKMECCFLFSPLIKSRCQGTILWACLTQHNCFLIYFLGFSALVERPFRLSSSTPLDSLQF